MENLKSLHALINKLAVKRGEFVLSSGQKSKFYIDLRLVTLHGFGNFLTATCLADLIRQADWKFDFIGGVPLGSAIVVAPLITRMDCDGFLVRKEVKSHGTQNVIEGHFQKGSKCVIVEDVTTSGGSAAYAIETVRNHGGEVVGVVSILDRQQGAAERFDQLKVPFRSLFTTKDFELGE